MKDIIKNLTSGIRINTESIEKIKKSKKTITYMNSLDFNGMPDEIKEMNESLLENAKKVLNESKNNILSFEDGYEGEDCVDYALNYDGIDEITDLYKDIECLDKIADLKNEILTENVKNDINNLKTEKNKVLEKFKVQLRDYVEKAVKREFLNEGEKPSEPVKEAEEVKPEAQRIYTVRKTGKSPQEIRDIIQDYIRINETIFNKIIFESKPATLSISERVLDVYFKPGTGYIMNFISEPDTNYGKFYRNLLKVFNEIKEYVFDNFDIVVIPEDGKAISYLNSFYQNYIFVREKFDSALIQYKLQNSLLNENFSVKYLIFEKITGKYLIFYNGNKDLSKAVESYFQNQAKLGTMSFNLEFVEYQGDVRKMIADRLDKIRNHIELSEAGNYMKVTRMKNDSGLSSVFVDVTGVKILIDPETEYDGNDIDIVIMSNARDNHVKVIPQIMNSNPGAKLFTSDISFKIARIKWMKELNNPNLVISSGDSADFTRKDIDNLNERVIRITPMGKGYNFKGLVNIKFFSSGSIPGSSIVEIRDSSQKTIYLGIYTSDSTGLLKGADNDLSDYNYLISSAKKYDQEFKPLPLDLIKEKLKDNRQVFIFSDSIGNLQHLTVELYNAGIDKQVVSGETTFGIINKELAKLLNFGSSWGDNFEDKDAFYRSISKIEPLADEYEFYKKFSTNEPGIFILPFEKMEVEMVLKNKLNGENLVFIPSDYEKEFLAILEKDVFVSDENKTGAHIIYNYIRNTTVSEVFEKFKDSKVLKKVISDSDNPGIPANRSVILEENTEKVIY
jgi:hypothetical protein